MTILAQPVKENTVKQALTVKTYTPQDKKSWDNFVDASKNGVFLFKRDYMEYHKDRFQDHSLLFYKNGRLVGLMPANISGDVLQSHGGLTFGGVISSYTMKTPLMLDIFKTLIAHCQSEGIREIIYKPIPYIYHAVPAEEDLYALFTLNAKLIARSVSSSISLSSAMGFDSSRRDNLRKAKRNNLVVKESHDFEVFMAIEKEALTQRHGVTPVHTAAEIKLLAERFSENIKLFGSFKGDTMLAGVVIYESKNVAHMQYAANSAEGWNVGAQDIIEDYLISEYYRDKRFFDFGISTENSGKVMNMGLIKRKESFGASAVVYDVYQIVL